MCPIRTPIPISCHPCARVHCETSGADCPASQFLRCFATPNAETPVSLLSLGARAAPHALAPRRAEDTPSPPLSFSSRCARSAARSRRARGRRLSRMPGTKTSDKSWKTRSRSANEMADRQRLTGQARAFPQRSAGGPAPPSRACANESLQPRAEGAARPRMPRRVCRAQR